MFGDQIMPKWIKIQHCRVKIFNGRNSGVCMAPRLLDGIPPERYLAAVLQAMKIAGMTISEIELRRGRKYDGGSEQMKYRDKPVWHAREDIDIRVAEILLLDKNVVIGKDKPDVEFQTRLSRQIIKLRKNKQLADWNISNRFRIHRLVVPIDKLLEITEQRALEKERARYLKKDVPIDLEQKMMNGFVRIIRHGKKDTTYKFALARAMLDHCKKNKFNENITIQYKDLASLFLKYYWHQGLRFKIKQNFKSNEPNMITIVREIFKDDKKKQFRKIDPVKKKKAIDLILEEVFGDPKKKKNVVIPAFHRVKGSSEAIFYDYDEKLKCITLKPGVAQFFCKNYYVLLMTTIAGWAKFLEKANHSLPRLISKIERENERRNPLGKFKEMYIGHTYKCFYCCTKLVDGKIEVDHFIPWTYMFDDDAWNLVLACKDCNRDKKDALPKIEFKNKLINRNRDYHGIIDGLGRSIEMLENSGNWKTEIEKHYELCKEHEFDMWDREFDRKCED